MYRGPIFCEVSSFEIGSAQSNAFEKFVQLVLVLVLFFVAGKGP